MKKSFDLNKVSGDDCKFLVFLMLGLHDRKLLLPRIKKLAKLMTDKKCSFEIMGGPEFQELWEGAKDDYKNALWITRTYDKWFPRYSEMKRLKKLPAKKAK